MSGAGARGPFQARRRAGGGRTARKKEAVMGGTNRGSEGSGELGLGGMLRSLGGFVELLSDLAERGGELRRSGEIGEDDKGVKAVWGFTVRAGGAGPRVERFGNVKEGGLGPTVEETREPMVDVFDEEGHLLVVAELPGVEAADIHHDVNGDVLVVWATRGERKYRKEVLLPCAVAARGAAASHRNGVFELKLPKAG
ncbi:MAG: Hsp20/alpha crystallin family protein [Deltaproteobacteria bacterium]|nr:Hsp20/alpha crystallin family protein [Deltaproteobacteria bacterium]